MAQIANAARHTIWVLTYTHYGFIVAGMNSVSELIDLLGGPTPVAAALNMPITTVRNWKGRESIPARYHAAFLRMGSGKITAEMLTDAHERSAASVKIA